MARNVADLALLLSVQAGHDRRVPLSLEGDGSRFLGPLHTDMKGKRIGWLGDFGGATPCEPGLLDTCRSALKTSLSIPRRFHRDRDRRRCRRKWFRSSGSAHYPR